MKRIFFYLSFLILLIQCRKESEDCHYFITIKNNSNKEVIFSERGITLDDSICGIVNVEKIIPNNSFKHTYSLWDCLELILNDTHTLPMYIIDIKNYTTEAVPCEEFEVQNTILRTYVLTLEDLERMNYTINYPEDASIGVE